MVLRVATAVVLPLVVMFHALGYYAARSGTWTALYDRLGLTTDAVSLVMASGTVMSLAGTGAAMLVGAAVGPLPTMALGLGLYAFGAVGQAFAPEVASFTTALSLSNFGAGMYRPAMLVACIRPFGVGWDSARIGVLLLAYAGANLGALPAGLLFGWIGAGLGSTALALFSAVVSGIAAVACLGLFGASWLVAREAEPEIEARPLLVAGLVTLVGGLGYAAWMLGMNLQSDSVGWDSWISQINPVVVFLAAVAGALGCFGCQLAGLRVPALVLAGVGFLLVAVGLGVTPAFGMVGLAAIVPALVVGAVGEAFLLSPLVSQAAGGLNFRVAIVPAAILVGAASFTSLVSRGVDAVGTSPWIGGIGAVGMAGVCAVVGVGAIVAGVVSNVRRSGEE